MVKKEENVKEVGEAHPSVQDVRMWIRERGIIPSLGIGDAKIIGFGKRLPHTQEEWDYRKWTLKCCGCPEEKLEQHTERYFRAQLVECRYCGSTFEGVVEDGGLSIVCPSCKKMMLSMKKEGKAIVGSERPYTVGLKSPEEEKMRFRYDALLFNRKSWLKEGKLITVLPDGGMVGTAHWGVVDFSRGYPLEVTYW